MNFIELFAACICLAIFCEGGLAQNVTSLHTFGPNTYTNTDGAGPEVSLVVSGKVLYGAAGGGANGSGTNNYGTVFSLNLEDTAFSVLHTFSGVSQSGFPPVGVNDEGFIPSGTLVLADGTLYGAAGAGGTNGSGTLFSIDVAGAGFTVLHTFATNVAPALFSVPTNSEGANPNSLVLDGDTLYGTTPGGGTNGFGTVFAINTNGSGFKVLHTFRANDGKNPQSILAAGGGMIYGATPIGGTNGAGTVYSVSTNGGTFTVVHTFASNGTTRQGPYLTGLLLYDGKLFGTASAGGSNATGVVFSLNTNGTGFREIYTFSSASGAGLDGANPEGALALLGDTLYGTANSAGANRNGVVFCVNTNGTTYNTMYAFSTLHVGTNSDGTHPESGVVLAGNSLYGTAYYGGGNGNGTLYALPVAPTITRLELAGTNLLLNGINGLAGRACAVLSSTNPALSLNQWTPLTTNTLPGGASFSLVATNCVEATARQQFYRLRY